MCTKIYRGKRMKVQIEDKFFLCHELIRVWHLIRYSIYKKITNVGFDTFGPWQIVTRRTRGGQAHGKR